MNKTQLQTLLYNTLFILTQTLQAGGIAVDTRASKTNQATLVKAPNGIEIVNIVKPNANGLSHNKFEKYNVEKRGIILNNSNKAVKTELSGFISHNPNLQGKNAKIILNELTGTSKSLLEGFSEVAGKKADVIVANPNGITINGGGFINTNRVILTTGKALFKNDKLKGFDVNKGDIYIKGEGFNTNNIDSVALFSKALHVNAKFYANKADIVLGSNRVNLDGSYETNLKEESGVSLDSTLLGGIYANSITLISSDKGVGVNLPPEVLAQESLILNVNGDITNKGVLFSNKTNIKADILKNKKDTTIYTQSELNIEAKSVNNQGLIKSDGSLTINTQDSIKNEKDAIIDSAKDMLLVSKGDIKNNSDIISNKNITIKANILTNYTEKPIIKENTITTRKRVSRGGSNDYDIVTTTIYTQTVERLNKASTIIADENIEIKANTINNNYSLISSNKDINIKANTLNNKGVLLLKKVTTTTVKYRNERYCKHKIFGHCVDHGHRAGYRGTYTNTEVEKTPIVNYAIQAKDSIVSNTINLNNSSEPLIDINEGLYKTDVSHLATSSKMKLSLNSNIIVKEIKLPTGSYTKYILINNKKPYLVEKNPLFTNFNNFISSDYMLEKLNLNPELVQKRLGDGAYESELVQRSIIALKGSRYLKGYNSNKEQFKALMDNAIEVKDELQLTLGVTLSKEQIKALKKDIIWLEEKEIENYKVLVPVVYLSSSEDGNYKTGIKADNLTLNSLNLYNINADIKALKDMTLTNGYFLNQTGTLISNNSINIYSNQFNNLSSTIKAKKDIKIRANSFNSKTVKKEIRYEKMDGYNTQTIVADKSNIKASNIDIKTIDSINIIASNLEADNRIYLTSYKGDVNIESINKKSKYDFNLENGYIRGSQTNQISSNLKADNINIQSNSLHVKASNLEAQDSINIDVKEKIDITSAQNTQSYDYKHEIKGGFLGGDEKTQDTKQTTTQIKSLLKAKNITLNAKEINQIASDIETISTTINTQVLNLISKKDTNYENHFKQSSTLLTQTVHTKGYIKEKAVASQIKTKKLIFNKKDITNKLKPIEKTVKEELNQELNQDNIIKILSSEYNLNQKQINQVKAILSNKEWDEKHTSLSAVGAIIVAIVVTLCTAGAGTAIVASGMSAAGTATTAAAISAGTAGATATITAAATQAVVSGITTQLVTAGITGEDFKLDTKSLVKSAITAGVLSGATTFTDSLQGIKNIEYKNLSFSQKLTKSLINTTLKSGINSAVYGTDFEDSLKYGLATQATNLGFEYVGSTSMSQELYKNNPYFQEGAIGKIALHSAMGGVGASLAGGDFKTGAITSGFNEALSPLSSNYSDQTKLAISQLSGTLIGAAINGNEGATTGYNIATSAELYNRQLHQDEIKWIKQKAKEYAKINHISEDEARKVLYMGAMYYNNKSTKDMFDKIVDFNNDTSEQNRYTKQDMQKAYTFLKENSKDKYFKSIDSSDLSQQRYQRYFTSTKGQYEDNSLKLPITIGLEDESYMLVPTTPLLRTTTKAGNTLTKATLKEADKIYLQTGIKTDNFIKTEVVPKVTDAYYSGKNFVYDPENVIKGMSIADTVYGAISPEPPMTPQQLGGYLLKNYIYDPIQNSILNQDLNNEK